MKYCLIFVIAAGILFGTHVHATERTLRDKIGQMLMISFDGAQIDADSPIVNAIQQNNIGGVILFDYNPVTKQFDKNIANPSQVNKLNTDLQQVTETANITYNRAPLPLLIGVDYEGGKVTRLKETYGFPPTLSAAEVGKRSLTEANNLADTMAQTLNATGFNLDFAPVVDVNINPDNPIIGLKERSFSDNPNDVVNYAEIYAHNFLTHHIQCIYKHFPGHGSSREDSHLGFVDVTTYWQPDELEPYRQLLSQDNSCGMVMTAHVVNRQLDESGLPATLSYKILTGILREELKFDGVIISDDMQMNAISQYYGLEQAVTLAINAGVDMLTFGNQSQDPEVIIDIIEKQVKAGKIPRARIEEAYHHIVTLKQTLTVS